MICHFSSLCAHLGFGLNLAWYCVISYSCFHFFRYFVDWYHLKDGITRYVLETKKGRANNYENSRFFRSAEIPN
jgi:hypothetical protein